MENAAQGWIAGMPTPYKHAKPVPNGHRELSGMLDGCMAAWLPPHLSVGSCAGGDLIAEVVGFPGIDRAIEIVIRDASSGLAVHYAVADTMLSAERCLPK